MHQNVHSICYWSGLTMHYSKYRDYGYIATIDNPHPLPLPVPVLEHILSKMSRLHSLGLHYGAVSTTGAVAMAELIKNNNTLGYVAIVAIMLLVLRE